MQQRVGALCVEADQFFLSRRDRVMALAARYGLPAIYNAREYVEAGGLMSYGTPLADAHRLMGIYAGRVLKGEKPADFPVQQSVNVELIINMKTAKTLGLTFPITLLGRADAWPLAARAQQPAVPVIGLLTSGSRDANVSNVAEFRKGLHDAGYVEGQNVMMEYRWDDGQYDRMPELAAELVRRRVAVIATPGSPPAARAAKAATATIPIVFGIGEDPVKLGLVASLDRPGGNLTGINFFSGELVAKRLGLLRELLPGATRVALLVNPADSARAEYVLSEAQTAARALGLQIEILKASTVQEINAAFATLMRDPADALFVGPDGFFNTRRVQFANLAARHRLPTTFAVRNYVEVGGLMSYGTDLGGMYREVGVYTGRILKGAKPADLPVLQSTKFELVINIQTARMLELEIPPTLLAHTDEVIE